MAADIGRNARPACTGRNRMASCMNSDRKKTWWAALPNRRSHLLQTSVVTCHGTWLPQPPDAGGRRIERHTDCMSIHPRESCRGFSPYLYYEDAGAALEWLSRMFGFREKDRFVDGEGVVREAEMYAGETIIMMHGADPGYWKEQAVPGPIGHMCIVYVDDVDAHHARAVEAGLDAPPPADQPYGARIYLVEDIGGHQWTFWQHLTDDVELQPGWRRIRATD